MTTSLTIPVSALKSNDWPKFLKQMDRLGRLTDEEIDPLTWRHALKKAGISFGDSLEGLVPQADGKDHLLMSFSIPDLKTVKQKIIFSGHDKEIRFNI